MEKFYIPVVPSIDYVLLGPCPQKIFEKLHIVSISQYDLIRHLGLAAALLQFPFRPRNAVDDPPPRSFWESSTWHGEAPSYR